MFKALVTRVILVSIIAYALYVHIVYGYIWLSAPDIQLQVLSKCSNGSNFRHHGMPALFMLSCCIQTIPIFNLNFSLGFFWYLPLFYLRWFMTSLYPASSFEIYFIHHSSIFFIFLLFIWHYLSIYLSITDCSHYPFNYNILFTLSICVYVSGCSHLSQDIHIIYHRLSTLSIYLVFFISITVCL